MNQPINKIVAVTPDVPYHDLREPSHATFYVPFSTQVDDKSSSANPAPKKPVDFATFVIHTDAQNPLALASSLRQLHRAAPQRTSASRTSRRSSICSATKPFASA